jgi:hypothetical protein
MDYDNWFRCGPVGYFNSSGKRPSAASRKNS